MDAVEVVAGFVEQRAHDALGVQDLDRMTLLVLDGLGCLFGGSQDEAVLEAFSDTATLATVGDGSGTIVRAWPASFVHGVALRYLDYLDTYSAKDTCHPAEHLPVALAVAQAVGATGRDFLEALATGYEVQCRLADAVDLRQGGMHHVTAAAVSVPMVAARLGALPMSTVRDAVALAVARGVFLRSISQGALSMAKAFAFPLAAKQALECVDLAVRGVTGPRQSLDDLLRRVGTDPDALAPSFADPSASPHLGAVQVKAYPVQYALQAIVECGTRLHPAYLSARDQIAAITVRASGEVLNNTTDAAKRQSANRETADHSLYSCLGMALVHGQVGVADFREHRWLDEGVRRIADLITCEMREAESSGSRGSSLGAQVELRLAGGSVRTATVDAPLGSQSRPMSEAQVVEKFSSNSAAVLGEDGVTAMVRSVKDLDARQTMTGFLPGLVTTELSTPRPG